MPISVVTIDFWNTLFDSTGGAARNEERLAVLESAVRAGGSDCSREELVAAYRSIWAYFDDHWLNNHRTPTSAEMVAEICRRASVEMDAERQDAVVERFARGVLEHPPQLLPGARAALEHLASRSRLALISDTAFSPGDVLRELMRRNDVERFFDTFVFSDETGVSKPHPDAFGRALGELGVDAGSALHIGDIERTDIQGAKSAGLYALLYRGDGDPHKYAEETTIADGILEHWDDIAIAVTRLDPEWRIS